MFRTFAPLLLIGSMSVVGLTSKSTQAQGPSLISVVDITVDSVEATAEGLIANLEVVLDIAGREDNITLPVAVPLNLGGSTNPAGGCDILNLSLGPIHLDLLGLVVDLDNCADGPVTIDITGQEGALLGDLLCEIAGLLNDGLDLGDILDNLDLPLPVGASSATDALTGAIADVLDQVFAALLGLGEEGDHVASDSNRRCDILNLELQEIELNVLGLVVETSDICLDVYAVRGGGNLLGNLLCGVTHLLDNPGNPLGGQAALLKNINKILDRLGL
jgi:hypothetical protein